MIRVLMVTDSLSMAGAFWRSAGPFSELNKSFDHIQFKWVDPQIVASGQVPWSEFRWTDWVFMHRPATPVQYEFYKRAKDLGCKIWIDIDDHLFKIPLDNSTCAFYNNPDTQRIMHDMVVNAEVVSTSTPFLKDSFDFLRKKTDTILLPNGIPVEWWETMRNKLVKREMKDKVPTIMWRGSQHHQKDLVYYHHAIIDIAKKYEKVHWSFVGFNPWFITEQIGKNWDNRPATEVTQYFKNLLLVQPDVTIVPIWDCEFNYSKSNIGWIESIFAGAVSLSPGWAHWDHPGSQCYKAGDINSFHTLLDKACSEMMTGALDHKWKIIDESWEFIKDKYDVAFFNSQIRKPILEGNLGVAQDTSNMIYKELYPKHVNIIQNQTV